MTEEEKKLIDGFFNKGWCCDLDEIYNIVMKMSALIEKLQKENEKSKENYEKLLAGYNKIVKEIIELEESAEKEKTLFDLQ